MDVTDHPIDEGDSPVGEGISLKPAGGLKADRGSVWVLPGKRPFLKRSSAVMGTCHHWLHLDLDGGQPVASEKGKENGESRSENEPWSPGNEPELQRIASA
jgi:hypothetical protein